MGFSRAQKGEKSATVLVVDDEPLNRDLLRRVLCFDYQVREAEDPSAAIRVLENEGPVDVMICDHLMPGRSGTDLARDVRTRWPQTVSILLTGYDDAPEVEQARRDGSIFEVMGKPWLAPHLREAITRALAEASRRKS
ncbi:MAG: response regulator [Deltaproteobacteria bacterium]|nr:response regulator [Deltaproteobacteria bacterium]